jgi:hypothetical protein
MALSTSMHRFGFSTTGLSLSNWSTTSICWREATGPTLDVATLNPDADPVIA